MQTYYSTSDVDSIYRPIQRVASVPSIHERSLPYAYYDAPAEARSVVDRLPKHVETEEEQDHDENGSKPRRRIAVACARCRKRKIRCSGDPGDNTGCISCKTSGLEPSQCTFNRVGCESVEVFKPNTSAASNIQRHKSNGMCTPASFDYGSRRQQVVHHRPSLPALPYRGAVNREGDTSYHEHPTHMYGSFTTPRQESFGYLYTDFDGRVYGSSESMSLPTTAQYSPQSTSIGYTHLIPASHLPATARSSMSHIDHHSALNLGSLHDSLPLTTTERRLPVPQPVTWSQPQKSIIPSKQQPTVVGWRPHMTGVHDRDSMPWVSEPDKAMPPRTDSLRTSLSWPTQQSARQFAPTKDGINIPEPVLGYQFSQAAQYSPNVSPTTEADSSLSRNQLSRHDVPNLNYAPPPAATDSANNSPTDCRRPSAAMYEAGLNLYSFSTTVADHGVLSHPAMQAVDSSGIPRLDDANTGSYLETSQAGYADPRQMQPSQAPRYALSQPLQKQTSLDPQQQRARMSVSNLKATH